jgi:hypothetical protein
MAVKATVDKFGITFTDAYHKVVRLTYESTDQKSYTYAPAGELQYDEDGNPIPPVAVPPTEMYIKKSYCHFEVATYASEETRDNHSEPIYRSNYNFEPTMTEDDLLAQAYAHLKNQVGYEDAVDC